MYSISTINSVWAKADYVSANNESKGFRKDQCGAWIQRKAYGDRSSPYGWEIDHIKPLSKGGDDKLSNMRPLHWGNNASRQDDKLTTYITSEGSNNIYVETGKNV